MCKAVNAVECAILYENLWRQYISEYPQLLDVLKRASGLSDMFATKGSVNQAYILWKIRNEQMINSWDKIVTKNNNGANNVRMEMWKL